MKLKLKVHVRSYQYKGIAEAQAHALEHIQMGNVTVWGDKNTGADFAKSFVSNFAPVLTTINSEIKDQFTGLFGKKTSELSNNEEKMITENTSFEDVK